jgi:hypothetical protein
MMRARVAAWITPALIAGVVAAAAEEVRWALVPYGCDGEAFTRRETPLIIERAAIRWFNTDCTVVGSYKVAETWYLQARCTTEGKAATIPIMLEPRGDRLRVGWNREPIVEMQKCP